MNDIKKDVEYRLNAVKEKVCEEMKTIAKKYPNMKNWEVDFKYDWVLPCKSFIDEESNSFDTGDANVGEGVA